VRPAAIITDIEGTTTPIAFVHRVLFPYARERLEAFVASGHEVLEDVPEPRLETLRGWMDRDEKITPLKTIQGMIWAQGYARGEIIADLYPDVPPALRRWVKGGVRLYVYSSGSVAAQKQLFGHTPEGDLTGLFQGFFDTTAGPKREAASYAGICWGANIAGAETLFLSDVEAELDAAAEAGLQTCQLVRPRDGTLASARHKTAADFPGAATQFGLPRG
jgi:enolase-phosphatase E1